MKYSFLLDYIREWFTFQAGYERSGYLEPILNSIGSNTIKIITGIRRSGKSYILKQTIRKLLDRWVDIRDILWIHTEDERLGTFGITELREVFEVFRAQHTPKKVMYVFFDEIQNIPAWEKFVRSLQETYETNIQIFITGSNSNLLSSELATVLTGRYTEFSIFPFSFREFLGIKQETVSMIDPKKYTLFQEYLRYGGLPEVVKMTETEMKTNYIKSLTQNIVFKDIVQRYAIKKSHILESLLVYIYTTTCSHLSITSLVKYMKQDFKSLNFETLNDYLNAIENTFLINKLPSLADKKRHLLRGRNKWYAIDTGIRNIVAGNDEIEKIIENFVFIELKRRGYTIHCIEWTDYEIDFFAQKGDKKRLIQVCFTLQKKETYEREIRWFLTTRDQYEKIILTLDETNRDDAGITIINLIDWSLQDN